MYHRWIASIWSNAEGISFPFFRIYITKLESECSNKSYREKKWLPAGPLYKKKYSIDESVLWQEANPDYEFNLWL